MTIHNDDPTKTTEIEIDPTKLADDDPDVIAQKVALEALATEEARIAAGGAAIEEKPADGAKPKEDVKPAEEPEAITIPKARFDDVLKQLNDQKLDNARLEGALAATAELAKAKPEEEGAEEVQLTPEQVDAHFDKIIDDLDKKLDDGELSTGDWRKETRKYQNLRNLAQDELERRLAPDQDDTPAESLVLAERTDQLTKDRPWVGKVPLSVLKAATPLAIENLEAEGITLGSDEQSTLLLRAALIQIGEAQGWDKRYGGGAAAAKPVEVAKPDATKPATGADGKPLDPKVVAEKIALARAQPGLPDGGNTNVGSPELKEGMSEEELDALPPAARKQVMDSIVGTIH